MKKTLIYLFACSLFITACSDDSHFDNDQDVITEDYLSSIELRSADGKLRTLGFSYDVTGENLSKESIRRPVIDVYKLYDETKDIVIIDSETGGKNSYYYGYSSSDYVKEINNKTGFEASSTDADIKKLTGFGGNISYHNEFQSKYSYSSKYSFASLDIARYIQSLRIEENPIRLTEYLTPKFLADLNVLTPDDFVKYYGTHVLTNIVLGGHLKVMYRSSIIDESNYTRKKNIVKAGLNGALNKIGLKADADKETNIEETLTTKNQEERVYIEYKSGDGVGGGGYDLSTGKITPIDKYSWEKSVTLQNAGLVKIKWEVTYPIYDFITNPTKKAQIKAAVKKYIASKQIEVLELLPLYRIWNKKANNHFYTTSLAEAEYYVNNVGFAWDEGWCPSVKVDKIQGYILKESTSNTAPLYRLWKKGANNHFYTTSSEEANYYVNNIGFIWDSGWCPSVKVDKYQGFLLKTPEPGTVPLYRLWKKGPNNHFYTTSLEEANYYVNNIGFIWDSGWCPSVKVNKIQGYMYPAK